jgi:hypothetical protein
MVKRYTISPSVYLASCSAFGFERRSREGTHRSDVQPAGGDPRHGACPGRLRHRDPGSGHTSGHSGFYNSDDTRLYKLVRTIPAYRLHVTIRPNSPMRNALRAHPWRLRLGFMAAITGEGSSYMEKQRFLGQQKRLPRLLLWRPNRRLSRSPKPRLPLNPRWKKP